MVDGAVVAIGEIVVAEVAGAIVVGTMFEAGMHLGSMVVTVGAAVVVVIFDVIPYLSIVVTVGAAVVVVIFVVIPYLSAIVVAGAVQIAAVFTARSTVVVGASVGVVVGLAFGLSVVVDFGANVILDGY